MFQVVSDLTVTMLADDSKHPSTMSIVPINETSESGLDPEITYSFGNANKDDTRLQLIGSREGMSCTYHSRHHTLCGATVHVYEFVNFSQPNHIFC